MPKSCQRETNPDFLKPVDTIFSKDDRWILHEQIVPSIDEFHHIIKELRLNSATPPNVRVAFETVKNTLLYSFFSYRLSTPALILAFGTLEMALSKKFQLEKTRAPTGLFNKLTRAVDLRWIDVTKVNIPQRKPISLDEWELYVKKAVIPFIRNLRNDLSHDPQYLCFPLEAVSHISLVGRIINMLFSNNSKSA